MMLISEAFRRSSSAPLQVANAELKDAKAQLGQKEKELASAKEALARCGVNTSELSADQATGCTNGTSAMPAEKPSWLVRGAACA